MCWHHPFELLFPFNYYTLTPLNVFFFAVVPARTHLSWDLIASQFYRLQLANTPGVWWNRAVTGPAAFACSEARLRLLAKMKTKLRKTKAHATTWICARFHCVPDWKKRACIGWRCRWHIELVCRRKTQVMKWLLWPKLSTSDERLVYIQQSSDDDEENESRVITQSLN